MPRKDARSPAADKPIGQQHDRTCERAGHHRLVGHHRAPAEADDHIGPNAPCPLVCDPRVRLEAEVLLRSGAGRLGIVTATNRTPANAGSAITSAYERALHIPPGSHSTVRSAGTGADWTVSHA